MTAPSYCILDGDGGSVAPALPATDCETLGGGLLFTDDVANPPRPHEHPSAFDWMQMEQCLQRVIGIVPYVRIWATSAPPAIDSIVSLTTNVTALNIATAMPATGTFTFSFPTASMPSTTKQPIAISNGSDDSVALASQSGNVVTVRTLDGSFALTNNCSFVLDVYGGA